jgi:stage V sporulation protein D (sporulation-specific penicillin-binding protein)
MQPHLVREILDPNGNPVSRTEPTVIRQVISSETSAMVTEMLEQVVGDRARGTGKNAFVPGYRIGGKTGTSVHTTVEATTGQKQYIVSFVGIAPIEDPEIAVLVLLDSPSPHTGIYISGGQMAAPTVGAMLADILPHMGFEPRFSEEESRLVDKSVPNIRGLSLEATARW